MNEPQPGAGGEAHDSALRAHCAALEARLRALEAAGGGVDAEERARLRHDIATLIRTAQAQARAYEAVAEEAKVLVLLWKSLPERAGSTPADGPPADGPPAESQAAAAPAPAPTPCDERPPADRAAARTTTRADHLGASTYAAKAWSAYAVGDYAAAEAGYAHALALAPDDAELAALHAWSLAALGRAEEAMQTAQGVLAAGSGPGPSALARVALGRACLHTARTAEALEYLTQAARDDADRRATLYATFYLGVAYGQRGLYDDAVVFMRRALALGPNLVEAQHELGCALWRSGARAAALEAWRAGAAAGKFSPWAARCEELREHMERGGELPPT